MRTAPARSAVARTPVRLFSLPRPAAPPLLVGATPASLAAADGAARQPGTGLRGAPTGRLSAAGRASRSTAAAHRWRREADNRFERRMRWALVLVLLLALLLTGGNAAFTPLAWAEMPSDKALLHVQRGRVDATVGGVALPSTRATTSTSASPTTSGSTRRSRGFGHLPWRRDLDPVRRYAGHRRPARQCGRGAATAPMAPLRLVDGVALTTPPPHRRSSGRSGQLDVRRRYVHQ